MSSKHTNHNQYLVNIRKQRKHEQIEQIKNSKRFEEQLNLQISQNSCEQINMIQFDQHKLQTILNEQNIDDLYEATLSVNFYTIKTLQKYVDVIINLLCQRLLMPKALLSLRNIIKKTKLASGYIFEANKLGVIASFFKKLVIGSKQQSLYINCICQMLQNVPYCISNNLQQLYEQIASIFYNQQNKLVEDNQLIRLVRQMIISSNSSIGFNEQMLSNLMQYFWVVKKYVNRLNLYMVAINIIEKRLFRKSITVILHTLRVIIKGKCLLNDQSDIPSIVSLLIILFRYYNESWEVMDHVGQITICQLSQSISLHKFLLQYENDIFKVPELNDVYYKFLVQFCQKGPTEDIIQVWKDHGFLEQLIQNMTFSANICLQTLKIIHALLMTGSNINNQMAADVIKGYLIEDSIVFVLQLFHDKTITLLSEQILAILEPK